MKHYPQFIGETYQVEELGTFRGRKKLGRFLALAQIVNERLGMGELALFRVLQMVLA
jgi:hypothetical protein